MKDQNIASKIVDAVNLGPGKNRVLEIGPGTGVLTQFLSANKNIELRLVEIDHESVSFLKHHYPELRDQIVEGDFLALNVSDLFYEDFIIVGNFPYNISSQIFFKVLELRNQVTQVVCMLQKEVAERIAEKEGSKTYGILSVLLQAYYDIEFLFKVPPGVFHPPPKVMSAVIRLTRNKTQQLACDENLFKKIVKQSFQNRRKTLRNALKPLTLSAPFYALPLMDKRAEQLTVDQFITLTKLIQESGE